MSPRWSRRVRSFSVAENTRQRHSGRHGGRHRRRRHGDDLPELDDHRRQHRRARSPSTPPRARSPSPTAPCSTARRSPPSRSPSPSPTASTRPRRQTVTVNLTDVNDVDAGGHRRPDLQRRREHGQRHARSAPSLATDGDVTPTTFQSWTITGGTGATAFAINAATGQITVADGAATRLRDDTELHAAGDGLRRRQHLRGADGDRQPDRRRTNPPVVTAGQTLQRSPRTRPTAPASARSWRPTPDTGDDLPELDHHRRQRGRRRSPSTPPPARSPSPTPPQLDRETVGVAHADGDRLRRHQHLGRRRRLRSTSRT